MKDYTVRELLKVMEHTNETQKKICDKVDGCCYNCEMGRNVGAIMMNTSALWMNFSTHFRN